MNNKRASVYILFFILGIFIISFVSAGPAEDMTKVVQNIAGVLKPIAQQVLGTTPTGDLFFAKVLFFIIVLSIIFSALENVTFFAERSWVLWLISIAASVLSIRWIVTDGIIQTLI